VCTDLKLATKFIPSIRLLPTGGIIFGGGVLGDSSKVLWRSCGAI